MNRKQSKTKGVLRAVALLGGLTFLFFAGFNACKVDPPVTTINKLTEVQPEGWPKPVYTFSVNTLSEERFQLGRYLFYEPMLSKDNTVSCASCHQNFVAFANADHKVSHGINNLQGKRNAPALFNLTWHPYFMHDGGINHIEVQPLGPISNPVEMAESIDSVLIKLKATNKYRVLFNRAFGSEEVSSQKFLWAMAQFMGMMYSYNSKYDRVMRSEKGISFSAEEQSGYTIFKEKCNVCHTEPLFSDFKLRNNGLSVSPQYQDSGRARITHLPQDLYTFKTPSLRNIDLTGPYMHDGRISSLRGCLDHYSGGITNKINLAEELKNGVSLSEDDKSYIILFLKTLTDTSFTHDKKFTDPKYNP